MKVLFLHNNDGDYLAATLLHGLRRLMGTDCVDVPRYDCMYKPLNEGIHLRLRGHGFTVYGLLQDIPSLVAARHFWQKTLHTYDLIIIADIWAQWEQVWQLMGQVDPKKLVILDGSDASTFFPNAFHLIKRPWAYLTPISRLLYFKRELIAGDCWHPSLRIIPNFLRKKIPLPANAHRISFSIPAEKICRDALDAPRIKDFPAHIVDTEVARKLGYDDLGHYSFSNESEYFDDLRQARFGVTTKRGGWDCLRHYELAANGCVLCFRDLGVKPISCAPHGLNQENCIIYHDFGDLRDQISSLTHSQYKNLQMKSYDWINQHTTIEHAKRFLNTCTSLSEGAVREV